VAEFAEIDSRVKYHCHSVNIGALANFNYGMSQVTSPFFSFLSDDDILLPDFYKIALAGFEKFPDTIFSAGATLHMNDKGGEVHSPLSLWPREGYFAPPEGLYEMIGRKKGNHLTWTAILFRKEVKDKVGLLDEALEFADHDFQLRIAARFPFVVSKRPCAIFVMHDGSSCSNQTITMFWPAWLKIINNLADDERIPCNVRRKAKKALLCQLNRYLFALEFIKIKKYDRAYNVASILYNDLNEKIRGIILYNVAKYCENYEICYKLIYNFRRIIKLIKTSTVKSQIGDFSSYLNL
jgi:glycosyltransferase involved in cell wall biosynthesis